MFVETVSRSELPELEHLVNMQLEELKKYGYEIVDIKYGCMAYGFPYDVKKEYTAMIIYKESEEE